MAAKPLAFYSHIMYMRVRLLLQSRENTIFNQILIKNLSMHMIPGHKYDIFINSEKL